MSTTRLTVGQALVRFLAAQRTERDDVRHRLIEGCFGIFGHGNVAGLGQGLLEAELSPDPGSGLRYWQGRNEQAMVHAAAAFARTRNRMSTLACTSSVGPGALEALTGALAGWSADPAHRVRAAELAAGWQATVEAAHTTRHQPLPAQAEVIGVVNEVSADTDVVLCAAGSMPGDLHKLWRTRDPGGYHVEYGYSCMGYEIAGGLGAKMAAQDREVFVMVGDGSYLMMASELVTAVQEGIKLVVVCVDNHGFASIGNLSESVGSQRFGTSYRFRGPDGRLDGDYLPVDLAANAASLGVDVLRPQTIEKFRLALVKARASDRTTLVHIETNPLLPAPSSDAWWDVPVAEVAGLETTREARADYEKARQRQRPYL